jgi:hypothetical protein
MATANLFKNAKVIEAKGTAKAKPNKAKILVEGLEVYAAIDHAIKWLTTSLATAKMPIAEFASEKAIADGSKLKAKAWSSFDAEEGNATANIQLKKRSTNSGLNDIEKELVATYKVPVEVAADRPETFIINPERLDWINKNADVVSKALAKLGAPDDIIQFQTATTKTVTTDDSIDFVFRTYADKPDVIAQLLPVVGVVSIKPKFSGDALEVLKGLETNDAGTED